MWPWKIQPPSPFFFLFMFLNGRRRKNVFGGEEEDGKGKKEEEDRKANVLRSWHRRLEIRRRREKPKVGRSPFAQRYHTHLLAETNFLVLVLCLSMWRECVRMRSVVVLKWKRHGHCSSWHAAKIKIKIDWNFYFVSVSFHSPSRKKERKKVEKMFRVSGQFCRRRLNE